MDKKRDTTLLYVDLYFMPASNCCFTKLLYNTIRPCRVNIDGLKSGVG